MSGKEEKHDVFIQGFKNYLEALNMAQNTVNAYVSDASQFLDFLASRDMDVSRADGVTLLEFLKQLTLKKLKSSTKRRMMEALKRFYQAMEKTGQVNGNPFRDFQDMPKAEEGEARVLTEAEYRRLRDLVRSNRRKSSIRDYAILELALQTGLRRSEICALTLDHVEFSTKSTVGHVKVVKGKGGNERIVTLNQAGEKALKEYLAVRPKGTEYKEIFLNNQLKPCDPVVISIIFKRYMEMAGIKDASFHSLRHTFATHNLKKGTSIIVVQRALGHKSLTTTQKYTHLLKEMMDEQLTKSIL